MSAAANVCFVDTNVLLYTLDSAHKAKQAAARGWADALWKHRAGRLSWQVLHEFYANAAKIGAPLATVRRLVESYAEWQPIGFSLSLTQRAWHWGDQAGLSYWDALILAAAERSGCGWLLSEDFQAGRKYGTVQVVNPFQAEPGGLFEA
jgi:predicted nucleic acid-binding protein